MWVLSLGQQPTGPQIINNTPFGLQILIYNFHSTFKINRAQIKGPHFFNISQSKCGYSAATKLTQTFRGILPQHGDTKMSSQTSLAAKLKPFCENRRHFTFHNFEVSTGYKIAYCNSNTARCSLPGKKPSSVYRARAFTKVRTFSIQILICMSKRCNLIN